MPLLTIEYDYEYGNMNGFYSGTSSVSFNAAIDDEVFEIARTRAPIKEARNLCTQPRCIAITNLRLTSH
jgi:hypothetical protein